MGIKAAELPIDGNGNVYHLGLQPEELAHKIILVGDPERVPFFSQRLDHIELKRSNRELVTHTGDWKGKRISILSTGMGTDNIDIVLNELDALANIDLKRRCPKEGHTTLEMVRIGTSGILQAEIPMNSFIASRHSIGLDGLLHFYERKEPLPGLLEDFCARTGGETPLPAPYSATADSQLTERIAGSFLQGITVTAPGFYGPQCRVLRLPVERKADFVGKILNRSYNGLPYSNLEMETAGIYGLSGLLGHHALSISVGIANRATGEFSAGSRDALMQLFEEVIEKL